MSYESQNFLSNSVKLDKLFKFLELNGFVKYYGSTQSQKEIIASFMWFDNEDYKSWTGIDLSIYRKEDEIVVYTRTNLSRSYWDLNHQNTIVTSLKDYFGGYFVTDEGKNRILKPKNEPVCKEHSGCYLAFQRFEFNIGKAKIYLQNRSFTQDYSATGLLFLDNLNPRTLSNNLLLPYLVSVMEDYFKSTYIVLLKYSNIKEKILKDNNRISTENLIKISNNQVILEEALSENMSFQNIELISKHFQKLDINLDLKGLLSKPFRKRKIKLFESLNELVQVRHKFIHKSEMDLEFDEKRLKKAINDIEVSIDKFYKSVCLLYKWDNENVYFNGNY